MNSKLAPPQNCNQGKGVKVQRLIAGWEKQTAFAEAVGIPQSTLSDIENSKKVKPEYITRIAKFLGIDENQIAYYPDEGESNSMNVHENKYEPNSIPVTMQLNSNTGNIITNNNPVEDILKLSNEKAEILKESLRLEEAKSVKLIELIDKINSKEAEIDTLAKLVNALSKKLDELTARK